MAKRKWLSLGATSDVLSVGQFLWDTIRPYLVPAAGAVAIGYLAKGAHWIGQFGPFGWASAGTIAFLVISAGLRLAVSAYEKLVMSRAEAKWARDAHSTNPMKNHFENERFSLRDIAHPISQRIKGKSFKNCELIGPQAIVFTGTGLVRGVGFHDCDFVHVRDGALIKNIIVLEDCSIDGGSIWRSTIFGTAQQIARWKADMPSLEVIT